jgi:tRNA pseudouridine38-40 synthase
MARYRATLAYDGTAYQGFQRQADGIPTIQGALEAVLNRLNGMPITVVGAGRTDTGVHATGQVIAFECAWKHSNTALQHAINGNLPHDIAICDLRQQEGFHPRFDALSRTYRYVIVQAAVRQPLLRDRGWWVRSALDVSAATAAATLLIGRHDFGAFGKPPQGENTVRTVFKSEWTVTPKVTYTEWAYVVEANAFLQHMVRRIVGALADVARGTQTLQGFAEVFYSGRMPTKGRIAPPQGLTLESVRYPDAATGTDFQAGETLAKGQLGNGYR